jgi:hypothetical protein
VNSSTKQHFEKPTIALSELRISWLMFARKLTLNDWPLPHASLAIRNSCSETSRESFNFLVRQEEPSEEINPLTKKSRNATNAQDDICTVRNNVSGY